MHSAAALEANTGLSDIAMGQAHSVDSQSR
jgi:hypothetical protein